MADPSSVSIVVPAFNEEPAIGALVRGAARGRAPGTRSSSWTTGRRTPPRSGPRGAGATVVRHPYNKGNGAAVKTGIRRATGEYVLIVDGDGQHQAADAARLVSHLGEYDLVIGARSTDTQATHARLLGNAALNWLAGYLTGRTIPDLTSGFRGARRSLPPRVPPPAAQRLLHAHHDDAGVHQGGLQRPLRADRGRRAGGPVEDPAGARRREVPADRDEDRHAVQPAPRLPADQPRLVRSSAPATPRGPSPRSPTSPIRRCCSSCWR